MSRLPLLLISVALISVAVVGCVEPLDLRLPVVLVPDPAFSAEQLQAVEEAAESWNMEVGTRMEVSRSSSATQQVPVILSEMTCAFANGVTSLVDELEVKICALDAHDLKRFHQVTLHELGHVVNIRGHAEEPLAVMSAQSGEKKRFHAEDHQLFREANPAFKEHDGCDIARRIGASLSRPVLVQAAGGRTIAIWAEATRLRFTQLDFETAKPSGATGSIPTPGTSASWIRPLASAEGFTVSWVEGRRMYRAAVTLPAGKVVGPTELALPQVIKKLDFEREVTDLSTAAVGQDLYLALTTRDAKGQLHLLRFEAASGTSRSFAPPVQSEAWGQLVTLGGELHLVMRQQLGLRVDRLAPDGKVLESLPLSVQAPIRSDDTVQAQVIEGSLVVASRLTNDPIRLYRVMREVTGLRLDRKVIVKLPGSAGHTLLSMAGTPCGLGLGVNHATKNLVDVFVTVLNPTSLKVDRAWKRLSPPDRTQSFQPWLAAQHCRFLAVWRDLHSWDKELVVRSRCF
jgi:hypothetical protein